MLPAPLLVYLPTAYAMTHVSVTQQTHNIITVFLHFVFFYNF
ncbi:hypothetical protein PAE4_10881 [Bacillus altitudinis]|nr:hypothetical protein PAE4_10881 [Bacillus altitudinis]